MPLRKGGKYRIQQSSHKALHKSLFLLFKTCIYLTSTSFVDKFLSWDPDKMTVAKENGFNSYPNSHRYPGSNRDDMLPVASTSDESRYINNRIDNLRKPGGSVAALKELVSCFLNYKLLDN